MDYLTAKIRKDRKDEETTNEHESTLIPSFGLRAGLSTLNNQPSINC